MRKFFLTLCFSLVLFVTFADKLVLIPITEANDLESLFKNNELKIHYYCDSYVLATTSVVDNDHAIVLDENAFADVFSYAIVYCHENYKAEYLPSVSKSSKMLYNGNNFFVMKILSSDFMPAKNDGMIAVRNIQARLPKTSITYPVITEPDEDILNYLSQVSIDRMMADIQTLQDFETRFCRHPHIFVARDWIKNQFDALDLNVTLHNFPYFDNDNDIAIQYGTEFPNEYVVCGAHYDSYSTQIPDVAPGADDNASGTAGILEIAKILSKYDFKRSIIYCAFSAEELGLIGSGYYAEQCASQNMNIVAYFNMDMIGYLAPEKDIRIHFSNPTSAKILADYCQNISEVYFPEIPFSYNNYMSGSDHRSFINAGYMGITSIEHDFTANPYYHQINDIIGLGINSPELVEVIVRANLASVATLAMYGKEMSYGNFEINPKFKIYPNPTTGELRIENGEFGIRNYELGIMNVEIFDIYGRKQSSHHLITSSSNHLINISHLPAGIYFITIANEFVGKFIKE